MYLGPAWVCVESMHLKDELSSVRHAHLNLLHPTGCGTSAGLLVLQLWRIRAPFWVPLSYCIRLNRNWRGQTTSSGPEVLRKGWNPIKRSRAAVAKPEEAWQQCLRRSKAFHERDSLKRKKGAAHEFPNPHLFWKFGKDSTWGAWKIRTERQKALGLGRRLPSPKSSEVSTCKKKACSKWWSPVSQKDIDPIPEL